MILLLAVLFSFCVCGTYADTAPYVNQRFIKPIAVTPPPPPPPPPPPQRVEIRSNAVRDRPRQGQEGQRATLTLSAALARVDPTSPSYSSPSETVATSQEEAEPPLRGTRPNIIVIVADDMGYGDVGSYWEPAVEDTPNLNRLARKGIEFTDFHTGASKCTPSRSAFLTGRLGLRTGVVANFDIHAVGGLPTNETTFGEILKKAGYRTSMIGKWHQGQQSQFLPSSRGFDGYLGLPYSNDMGCVDHQGDDLPYCPPCPSKRDSFSDGPARCYLNHALPLLYETKVVQQPPDLYDLSSTFTRFMRKQVKDKNQPFLLYFAAVQPHVPMTPSERAVRLAKHTNSSYRQSVFELDLIVGDVVKAVEKAGISNNTLIWFISDNGPWAARCQYGGSVGPFTGKWQQNQGGGGSAAKGTVWEAGHRVPSIVYWPGTIPPGIVSSELTSTLDFLPTFANLAGADLPSDRSYDGVDISRLLLGEPSNLKRALFHPNSGNFGPDGTIGAVRVDQYKAVYYTGGDHWPDCSNRTGPGQFFDPPLLFDLHADPEESSPLEGSQYEPILQEIKLRLENFSKDVRQDRVSTADFTTDWNSRICCNSADSLCRCF